jgi:hypothetical protein
MNTPLIRDLVHVLDHSMGLLHVFVENYVTNSQVLGPLITSFVTAAVIALPLSIFVALSFMYVAVAYGNEQPQYTN